MTGRGWAVKKHEEVNGKKEGELQEESSNNRNYWTCNFKTNGVHDLMCCRYLPYNKQSIFFLNFLSEWLVQNTYS